MLTAYYDLAHSPPTYDIVAFLSAIEVERRARNVRDSLRVVFVPGPAGGFRQDKLWPHSIAERELMLDRVAVPMARMLPSCAAVDVLAERPPAPAHESIGLNARLYGLFAHVRALRAGCRPLRPPEPVPAGYANVVTITLREAEHWPARNSDLDAWYIAARAIRDKGYQVMIVRDTRHAACRFGEFNVSPEASIDLTARARLYAMAGLNLFVSNGPAWFAVALNVPTMIFKPVVEGLMPTCSAAYFARCGLPVGSQLPGAPHQRIIWAPDTAAAILDAFAEWEAGSPRRGMRQ
jgi:hypothetical protein